MEPCVRNVLFLCTGNSARSILAETILNDLSGTSFCAFSAGSQPKGEVHPYTVDLLLERGHHQRMWRSKSWNEFAQPDASRMNFVITVCDDAAGEACPVWPGRPVSAHWGIPDPAAETGSDLRCRQAFAQAYDQLLSLIKIFAALSAEQVASEQLMFEMDHMVRKSILSG